MFEHPSLGRRRAVALAACAAVAGLLPAAAARAQSQDQQVIVTTGTRVSTPAALPATTASVTALQLEETVNTVTAAGALQYLPSVHVRERYVGDRNGVLVMRVNSSIASAQTTVYADGLLLSNFLNNSFSTAPRWGLVSPDEIERVDLLYGPFSALYPGNSAGGVVRMTTRAPKGFEAQVRVDAFAQRFGLYGTDGWFNGGHASAALGHQLGNWSFRVALDHLDNHGQPQTFGNTTAKAGAPAAAGTFVDVSGSPVIRDIDTSGRPRIIVSSTGIDHTVLDLTKLRLGWQPAPGVSATYTLGLWRSRSDVTVDSYLRDASGGTVFNAGPTLANPYKFVRIDGVDYTVGNTAPSRATGEHTMHGLELKAETGAVTWLAVASLYDQDQERLRGATPTDGRDGGFGATPSPGQVTYADGTGWHNLDLRGEWRTGNGIGHTLSFGLHHDRYRLASVTYGTAARPIADWQASPDGTLSTNSFGKTQTDAVYLQDEWRLATGWRLLAGLRHEHWKAYDGSNYFDGNAAPNPKNLVYADRSRSDTSPKLHLAWQATPALALRASWGKAVRYPTVAEMFQTFNGPGGLRFNDPNLKPEQVRSQEWVAQWTGAAGMLRGSYFYEDKRDALITQTDLTVTPNITSVQNVDKIRTQGFELAGQAADLAGIRGLDLDGSLTYADSRIVRDRRNPLLEGSVQPRIPDWRATLVATWRQSERFGASLAWRFSGRQHNQLLNTATGQYNDVNPNVYGAVSRYSVVDVKLLYRVDKRWSASLGINNLGNDKYYVNPNPYPQRTWYAGLKYEH